MRHRTNSDFNYGYTQTIPCKMCLENEFLDLVGDRDKNTRHIRFATITYEQSTDYEFHFHSHSHSQALVKYSFGNFCWSFSAIPVMQVRNTAKHNHALALPPHPSIAIICLLSFLLPIENIKKNQEWANEWNAQNSIKRPNNWASLFGNAVRRREKWAMIFIYFKRKFNQNKEEQIGLVNTQSHARISQQ